MNQTRSFLLIAWLFVAAMLWMEWGKTPAPAGQPTAETSLPGKQVANAPAKEIGDSAASELAPSLVAAAPAAPVTTREPATITLQNDVLQLTVDLNGGRLINSKLLTYTVEKKAGSPNVELLTDDSLRYFNARSGLLTANAQQKLNEVSETFHTADGKRDYALPSGVEELSVPLLWTDPETGLSVRRTLTLKRGSFVLTQDDQLNNAGSRGQRLLPYVELERVAPPPPAKHSGLTNPESFSFVGAAWYDEKFEKTKFDAFAKQPPITQHIKDGWIAMLQHYFVAAWLPTKGQEQQFLLDTDQRDGVPVYRITAIAIAPIELAPGTTHTHSSRLWVGPKLQASLAQLAPSLKYTVDYGIFTFIAQPLFDYVLKPLHFLIGNWGWAIILTVVLLKLALYPLSAAQYRSMAKMRAVQPRIEALKERYGDDKQQFQIAMMELYKKEKINPIGGCLPMLIPMPIFFALYWVLIETAELRHAPWMGWIQSLSDPDPYFILPVLNLAVMFLTQKMTPTPGMDPMQKKMMQFMPLVFGVMMAFFPAGLVLYWVTNGVLGLLQQQYITRRHGVKPATGTVK
jgi:YidC/Oxa1 family membrane protein insertase